MKDKKIKKILLLVIIIAVILLSIQYMNFENRRLLQDLAHLSYRLKRIEANNNMQRIITLEGDNTLMKEKMIKLQDELVTLKQEKAKCQKQLDKVSPKPKELNPVLKEKPKTQNKPSLQTKGNRGYLMR